MADRVQKSVITCDMEGRIETFNKAAEEIFGYSAGEVIGHKRVSVFSPGEVVLAHVPKWLETARNEGEYRGRTVFVRKDGSEFAADVRITPTFRNGEQIGYCGVTTPLSDVSPAEAAQETSFLTKVFSWMVITRAPFLTATVIPILIGATWAVWQGNASPFPWALFLLTMVGGIALHISANTFNDYFDWTSGTDKANNNYFLPYSGGSRSLELGLISEKALLRVAWIFLALAVGAGLVLMAVRGPLLLLFGAFGAFSAYFYTAPPLRLVSRKGLGELLIGLNFGPMMVAGTSYVLTGQLSFVDFLVGVPIGLLTMAILWINQFPDAEADAQTGKNHLVVVMGKERARWGYASLLIAAFGLILVMVVQGILPAATLAALAAVPLAVTATRVLFRQYGERTLIRANAATIQMQAIAGFLMAAGLLVAAFLSRAGLS